MPTLPIPLFARTYKNADGVVLTDDAATQYNGFIDGLSGLNIRPGEVQVDFPARRNEGLVYLPDLENLYGVAEGIFYSYSIALDGSLTELSSGPVTFAAGDMCTFAWDGEYIWIAGGGKLNYFEPGPNTITELADADAPTTVTHVAFLDGYILATGNGLNRFYWSDNPTRTSWSALSFASAEGHPDILIALKVVQRQIYLFGKTSVEIWENDGTTPFSRIPGGLIEVGCIAKHSITRHDNSLMWLSSTRQFARFNGIDVEFISSRYDKEIAQFSVVSDCIGAFIHKDGQEYCVFSFPSEGKTFAYNPKIDDWSDWGRWSSSTLQWVPYDFRGVAYDTKYGNTYVGKKDAQVVARLSSDSVEDCTGDNTTEPFKFLRRTGHIDNGSSKKKRVEELSFRARRGAAELGLDPKLMLRYRNNGSSQWSNIIEIDLGEIGETEHHIKLKRLGIFSSRQYEISATDNLPIVLANAEIDVTVLR